MAVVVPFAIVLQAVESNPSGQVVVANCGPANAASNSSNQVVAADLGAIAGVALKSAVASKRLDQVAAVDSVASAAAVLNSSNHHAGVVLVRNVVAGSK